MASKVMGLNAQIRQHAMDSEDWRHNTSARKLYTLLDNANAALFDGQLPDALIGFDQTGTLKNDGTYFFKGDGLSLFHHIELRPDLTELQMVVALIHNSLHLFQEAGEAEAGWYHTAKFRASMAKFGIKVEAKTGKTHHFTPKFQDTLKALGMETLWPEAQEYVVPDDGDGDGDWSNGSYEGDEKGEPKAKAFEQAKAKGAKAGSKSVKWFHYCADDKPVNIRAAVELDITCNVCGNVFVKAEANNAEKLVALLKAAK